MCARGRCVGNFCFSSIFSLLANITNFECVICFHLANFGSNQNDSFKENLFQPKSKQALHRDQFLHLSPTTENRNNPRKQFPRASHFHPAISTHARTHGWAHIQAHTPPHTKKTTNERAKREKTNRTEPPSRNPANCTGRRANFTPTRSESGSTRAGPHFRPGFAHKTPVFHSNSADRTQSRTRL